MRIFQKGFNFSQDGPGNRLVLHLQGCNFSCPWCSNPEGMEMGEDCKDITIQELVDLAVRSKALFMEGGGVTFTGGECTVQHGELSKALQVLQQNGVHTAIETNGSDRHLSELLPFVDYLMMDLKHPDEQKHRAFTGASNAATLENLDRVLSSGRQILVRIPLINGFNTDVQPFLDFFRGKNIKSLQVELLPYHEYGKSKWKKEYTMQNAFVDEKTISAFRCALEEDGICVINT